MTMSSWWVNRQQGLQPMRPLEHYKNGRRKPTIESKGDVKTFAQQSLGQCRWLRLSKFSWHNPGGDCCWVGVKPTYPLLVVFANESGALLPIESIFTFLRIPRPNASLIFQKWNMTCREKKDINI